MSVQAMLTGRLGLAASVSEPVGSAARTKLGTAQKVPNMSTAITTMTMLRLTQRSRREEPPLIHLEMGLMIGPNMPVDEPSLSRLEIGFTIDAIIPIQPSLSKFLKKLPGSVEDSLPGF